MRTAENASFNTSKNSSYLSAITINLLDEVHTCPALYKRACGATSLTKSQSASSKMINASLPPNSIVVFFKFLPASAATLIPPRSEPVKQTPLTRLSAIAFAT